MVTLEINTKYKKLIPAKLIKDYALQILRLTGNDQEIDLSILIDSDLVLHKLNNLYRGDDQSTDVLSFESNEINPETGRISLGDIAISYPTAEKQALEAVHPVENEIILLIIHGILHLSGFDHNTKAEKQEMWQKQQTILDILSIKINRISGDEEFHD